MWASSLKQITHSPRLSSSSATFTPPPPAGDNGEVAPRFLRLPRMEVQGRGGRSQDGPQLGCSIPGCHCCPGESRGQLRGRTAGWDRSAGRSPKGRCLWWWCREVRGGSQRAPLQRWCRTVAWAHWRVTPGLAGGEGSGLSGESRITMGTLVV